MGRSPHVRPVRGGGSPNERPQSQAQSKRRRLASPAASGRLAGRKRVPGLEASFSGAGKENGDRVDAEESDKMQCAGRRWAWSPEAPSLDVRALAEQEEGCSGPLDFIGKVYSWSSPLRKQATELPEHVCKAIRLRAALKSRTVSWRRKQLEKLKTIADSFPQSEGPRIDVINALLRKAGSRDTTLLQDSRDGFSLVGIIPASSRGEPLPASEGLTPAETQSALAKLLEDHALERRSGHWRLPHARQGEMLEILRREAQPQCGYWKELSASEAKAQLGQFCSWLYFPVDESSKVRGCLDPRELNAATSLREKAWIPGIDGVVALVTMLRDRLGAVSLRFVREDWESGFRQLVLCASDRRFLCAVAYDCRMPRDSRIRVFVPCKLMFGPRAGPNQFCRLSVALLEISNVYLAVCGVVHTDDTIIVDTPGEIDSARNSFVALAHLLNCVQKISKAFPPREVQGGASEGLCLGLELRLPSSREAASGQLCQLVLPVDKAAKYSAAIRAPLIKKSLQAGEAAKLIGRLEWAASTCFGRAARAFLWPLRDRQREFGQRDCSVTAAIQAALLGLLGFVKSFDGISLSTSTLVGFVDASSRQGKSQLGGCALTPSGGGFYSEQAGQALRCWLPSEAQATINEEEALATLVWLETIAPLAAGQDVLLFIDSEKRRAFY